MDAEQLAKLFHETYERLAPAHGYETRRESAKPWADVPEQNKSLMVAVCAEVRRAMNEDAARFVETYTVHTYAMAAKRRLLELVAADLRKR